MIAGELPIGAFEPLSRKRPRECDARIDRVVERSLQKSPDSRWSDAREMGDAVSRLLSNVPEEIPVASSPGPIAVPSPEDHGPRWKRVISNLFGKEFPVARIEGKLPRKFAEKVLEDVEVQRYLGRLVTLWPHFPGGLEVSKEGSRLKIELAGMRGDDPVRDKRVVAAIGAVLEANAHGKLKRIAVADHGWEDANRQALSQPPLVEMFAPIRPSDIGVQSQVVSGVERRPRAHRGPLKVLFWSLFGLAVALVVAKLTRVNHSDGTGHSVPIVWPGMFVICGLVAGVSFITFVIRGSRSAHRPERDGEHPQYNYWFSLAVTALWVGIVVANTNNLRDEEIAWLCVGAIASVFLLPRLPDLIRNAGRALLGLVGAVLALALVASFFYLTVSTDAPEPQAEIEAAPLPAYPMLSLGKPKGELPRGFGMSLLADADVRAWLEFLVPGSTGGFHDGYSATVDQYTLRAGMAGWNELDKATLERIAAALGAAAFARAPDRIEPMTSRDEEFRLKLELNPFPHTGISAPKIANPEIATIVGGVRAEYRKEFEAQRGIEPWIRGTLPFAERLFANAPGIEWSGRSIRLSLDPSWIRERVIHHYREQAAAAEDAAAALRSVQDEVTAVAAAYGMIAESLAPNEVKRRAIAPAPWEEALAKSLSQQPAWFPVPATEWWRIGVVKGTLEAGFEARFLLGAAARKWIAEVVPGFEARLANGLRMEATNEGSLALVFPPDWKEARLKAYAKDGMTDRSKALERLRAEIYRLCVAYGQVADRLDERVTRTAVGDEEMEKLLKDNPFRPE